MPIALQKISDDKFNADEDFHVRESKGCNLSMGIILLIVSIFIIVADVTGNLGGSVFVKVFYFLLIPAVMFIRRGAANQTIMTINRNGIIYAGKLLTTWDNFIDVKLIQEERMMAIQDNFQLFIKYYKDGSPGYFGRKIPLTNTQDKAEEEIIAAIKFYYKNC